MDTTWVLYGVGFWNERFVWVEGEGWREGVHFDVGKSKEQRRN